MAGINSRAKGSKNERVVAKALEQWTSYPFARVPSSGGLRWKNRTDTVGDVTCAEERHFFPFTIEVKAYKDINFEHLLYLPTPTIMKFWKQAKEDSVRAKKPPLLMMRYNGMPKDTWFLVMELYIYKAIKKQLKKINPRLIVPGRFAIINSNDLLLADYKTIRELVISKIDEKWPETKIQKN